MYMPGRRRTGSSPSRTVMSLAVYVASLIEKALETGRFRALPMVPERAVGIPLGKRHCGRFCDDFAKVLILDRGGQLTSLTPVVVARFGGGAGGVVGWFPRRLGERTDREAKRRRGNPGRRPTEAAPHIS